MVLDPSVLETSVRPFSKVYRVSAASCAPETSRKGRRAEGMPIPKRQGKGKGKGIPCSSDLVKDKSILSAKHKAKGR